MVKSPDMDLLLGDSIFFYLPIYIYCVSTILLMSTLVRPACIQPGTQCTGRFPDIVGMRISDDKRVELIPATSNFGS